MLLLIIYVVVALGFSFLCSVAEAVILSVTSPYIALKEQEGKPSGALLRKLCDDIHSPLAAILTLNTIAHTVGAAGAGAQAAAVFGNAYVGVISAVLTLLILILSEIIPKTLGAHYWRQLAPPTAYCLKYLIKLLYPFVLMAERLTRGLAHGPTLRGFSRDEFAVMAELSAEEGALAQREKRILQNLLLLRETRVKDAMTPRTVVYSVPEETTLEALAHDLEQRRFSRIPVYRGDSEQITGFVLRSDVLLAVARGHGQETLISQRRDLPALLSSMSLSQAFDEFQRQHSHILLIVDEYGGMEGILTMEDLIETLLGLEITDESDNTTDMQRLARQLWKQRARKKNLNIDELSNATVDKQNTDKT
ncbi:DUF21 domain-containing protein [Pseudomaricurvus alkylphenolicus]|jgi:CBS domain containing-hemolysin-like protein|uniref:CNNM domain-containing protein n=1 Tax=Pseudomaricurvus alkylphenolicus TaxID=1306991 RepID=UPI0014228C0F|nr:CNNM domain-containing protein [Pseudomaricurvus alkylphenolicus]NIB40750.1 DUF21 domain-containing protein [Pseudomaricurvus alkylphenolicus]